MIPIHIILYIQSLPVTDAVCVPVIMVGDLDVDVSILFLR